MISLNRILIPTNLGEPSRAAIRYGVALARQFDAKVFLVHVLASRDYDAAIETERVIETLLPGDSADASPEPDPQALAANAAREEMSQLLNSEDAEATRAEFLLRPTGTQEPGATIVACAEELDVELLVMGKHRIGFVEHLLAGSVTERVVRDAPCPVLIVHYPEREFVVDD